MLNLPRKSLRNKKGFTLIELLVVIVIIGILSAVAFPLYQNLTKNAADASAKGALAALRGAAALYYGQNGTYAAGIADVEASTQSQGGIYFNGNTLSVAAGGTSYQYTLSYDSTTGTVSCTGSGAAGTTCTSW
ncbi:prepilin-type N-terminal cleavage/methylation domain-containing protein [Thermodesulfobium sp. 4217-1]|uniref:type IV pilin protein n=1 Tax=Thermodesulfobium sp. 4217-1 TaxID=3120013 RepID=UPI003221AEE8